MVLLKHPLFGQVPVRNPHFPALRTPSTVPGPEGVGPTTLEPKHFIFGSNVAAVVFVVVLAVSAAPAAASCRKLVAVSGGGGWVGGGLPGAACQLKTSPTGFFLDHQLRSNVEPEVKP